MDKEKLTAYKLIREEDLTDIHSKGYILSHRKTGARVMLIENDDENKVFSMPRVLESPTKITLRYLDRFTFSS